VNSSRSLSRSCGGLRKGAVKKRCLDRTSVNLHTGFFFEEKDMMPRQTTAKIAEKSMNAFSLERFKAQMQMKRIAQKISLDPE
jgi:hypothetical protein